jgi:uracil-DNA glycosylase
VTAAFEQIRAMLPKLDPEERRKLKMLITKHPGAEVKRTAPSLNGLQADWLLQGILVELGRRGHKHHVASLAQVRGLAPDYELTSQEVREHLERLVKKHIENPTRAELMALGVVAATALIDYFGPRMPIGLKPVLNVVGRTTEAIENSFPDYLRSGMIYCLIKRRL